MRPSRVYTCIVCGAKGLDTSSTGCRKFCSRDCAAAHWRRTHGAGKTSPGCLFNDGVACDNHKCINCGWHPNVERRRKEAMA